MTTKLKFSVWRNRVLKHLIMKGEAQTFERINNEIRTWDGRIWQNGPTISQASNVLSKDKRFLCIKVRVGGADQTYLVYTYEPNYKSEEVQQ